MIGDIPFDVEAAARADVRAIAFRSGGWDDASLKGAAQIYDGPADLLAHYDESLLVVVLGAWNWKRVRPGGGDTNRYDPREREHSLAVGSRRRIFLGRSAVHR